MKQARLYEARRARDVRVILEVRHLSAAAAVSGTWATPHAQPQDGFLAAVLREMRETMPVDPREFYQPLADSPSCSLERALRAAATQTLGAVAQIDGFDQAKESLDQLVARYGRPLQPDDMEPADRERFTTTLLPVIQEAQVNTALAADLVRLARLESASRLLWSAQREHRFGASIEEWRKSAKVSSDETAAAYALAVIDDMIPAQVAVTTSSAALSIR